jgi:CBS domain-containing protein
MPIPDRYLHAPCVAAPTTSARYAARMMHESHIGSLVVIDDKKQPIGVVTDRDLALYVLTNELDAEATTIGDCMSAPPVTLPASASLSEASKVMRKHGVRRLPIIDDAGKLVGIITGDDLVLLLGRELNELSGAVQRGFAVESTAHAPHGSIFGRE